MKTKVFGKCQFKDCEQRATYLAAGRNDVAKCYCSAHAYDIANETDPEYIVDCPNCGCRFGVN